MQENTLLITIALEFRMVKIFGITNNWGQFDIILLQFVVTTVVKYSRL